MGKIDGATVKSEFSQPITAKTAKDVFNGKNADRLVGRYFYADYDGIVNTITFNKDGTGFWDGGNSFYLKSGQKSETHNFSYVSTLVSPYSSDKFFIDGGLQANYIGEDFAGSVSVGKDGKFYLDAHMQDGPEILSAPLNSVSELDVYGKTFSLGKLFDGKFSYVEFGTGTARNVRAYSFTDYDDDFWNSTVNFTSKILSANELEITANVPESAGTGVYTFVYNKAKNNLTVTATGTGKAVLYKGTVLKVVPVSIDDISGKLLSFEHNNLENNQVKSIY